MCSRLSDVKAAAVKLPSLGYSTEDANLYFNEGDANQLATVQPEVLVAFTDKIKSYLKPQEIESVMKAYYYAKEAHKGQMRRTGDPYITHPLAVASILADMQMDYQTLMAALLHDVIEDTGVAKYTLSEHFEPAVANMVDGVSKLTTIFTSQDEAQAKNFQKMAMATAKDIRIILIKFADRLHNMQTLHAMPVSKQKRIAKETLDFYAPIAARLGMDDLRVKFEDLGFKFLYPMRHSRLEKAVRKVRGDDRKSLLEKVRLDIEKAFEEDSIEAVVTGREKHLYSIYSKMKQQHTSFKDLTDVLAFRIVVKDIGACYRAIGVVHNLYKPVAGTFSDYIAIPKTNGYQSIHTCLVAPGGGLPIEIQIRTHHMDDMANNGMAGHWLYKSQDQSSPGAQVKVRGWVRELLDLKRRSHDPKDFIEHLRKDLFTNEIYVFSPKGEILELPAGSSPVDYAYAISGRLGYACSGCRVDRQLVPLSTTLKSGQTVEIMTSESTTPRTEWLSFVVTARARSAIRYVLRRLKRTDSIAFGRELLQSSLKELGLSLEDLSESVLKKALPKLKAERLDDLLYSIGIGDRVAYLTAHLLASHTDGGQTFDQKTISLESTGPATIRGTEGVVVTYAKCCNPIPGDVVIGHFQKNLGISIHVETCKSTMKLRRSGSQIYPVQWAKKTIGEFRVVLHVHSTHQRAALAEIAAVASAHATVTGIAIQEQNAKLANIEIALGVRNRTNLAKVIRKLREIKDVVRIHRSK